jgi:UDP-N-acetylglucosamine transferase subunit ALG13
MTTMLLATAGGHLRQLRELSMRLSLDSETVWVTTPDAQSRSLLDGENVIFVRDVRPRQPLDVLRCLPRAHRFQADGTVERAISTGSGIALGYLPYLAARGVRCHYIESATRVSGPSLTGRVMQRTPGVRLYTQYSHWAGGRWGYGGNILDVFESVGVDPSSKGAVQVVVTIGIATGFPFRRLLARLIPLLAPGGELSMRTGQPVRVLWQTAGTPTDDLPIDVQPILPADQLAEAMATADIVVSHCGTGSAVSALEQGRLPLLVPRDPAFGEIADDHQLQLGSELQRRGLAVVRSPDDIGVDDLLGVMSYRVQRRSSPEPFVLAS